MRRCSETGMSRQPPNRAGRRLASVVAAVASAGVWLSSSEAAGQSRSLTIEDFHADIEVHENGDVEILESISVRFNGRWNGIIRTIPVEYRTPAGLQYRLFLDLESITGQDGEELRYEARREGIYRALKIRVPGAQDAVRAVNIRYRVSNALRFFDEHDELYWNVTGAEWPFSIAAASARVTLPEAARGRRATAFAGPFGATELGRAEEIDEGFYFEASRPLGMREGLTVAVAWEPGAIDRPGALDRLGQFLRSNWLFLFPLLTLALMYRLWRKRGRDPAQRPIVPQYDPPEGLTPAEAGTLIDNRPDLRDLTASMVDLAVRGYLRIEEEKNERLLGLVTENDYRFVRTRDADAWIELHPHERALLGSLFKGMDSVRMSDLEHRFYKDLDSIEDGIFDRLLALRLYDRRPDSVLAAWIVATVVTVIVGVAGAVVVANWLMLSVGWSIAAALLTAAPVLAFGLAMPARTVLGARKLEEVLGFQEFLDRVESDRFRRLIDSPEMFERYLPYAMALGVEKKWARAFEDIYREPPDWYVGSDPSAFHSTMFVANLSDWSSRVGTAMASQPRSTGGSAFGGGGGGGFSGGGFGGGGGGGW